MQQFSVHVDCLVSKTTGSPTAPAMQYSTAAGRALSWEVHNLTGASVFYPEWYCWCIFVATGGFKVKLEDKKGKPIAAGTICTQASRKVL
jgi:hypothetical protein